MYVCCPQISNHHRQPQPTSFGTPAYTAYSKHIVSAFALQQTRSRSTKRGKPRSVTSPTLISNQRPSLPAQPLEPCSNLNCPREIVRPASRPLPNIADEGTIPSYNTISTAPPAALACLPLLYPTYLCISLRDCNKQCFEWTALCSTLSHIQFDVPTTTAP